MRRLLIAAVAACALLTAPATAKEPAAFATAADSIVAAARAEKVVGGSLVYIEDGAIRGERMFGFADEARQQKVDARTIYHWASITKTFTAIAIMQLAERKLINLDDPVVKYIPEFREVHNPFGPIEQITLRHLLSHSSGFRDPTWPWNPDGDTKEADWKPIQAIGWPEVMAMMPYSGIAFAPGTKYSYSNPGFSLLGLVLERVTGDDYESYMTKNVLMPLGMTRSYFDVTPYHLEPYRSNSYTWTDGKRIENGREFDTGATVANGGLNAPISDMIRYLNFLNGAGDQAAYDRILPHSVLVAMWQPLHPADYDATVDERMGEGYFTIDARGADGKTRRFIGHTGSQEGYRSFFYIDPESHAAVIMAVNTATSGKGRPLIFDARRRFFTDVFPAAHHGK